MQYTLFVILAPVATIASLVAYFSARRNQDTFGAIWLSRLILLNSGWLIFNTLELASNSEAWTLLWAKISYFFIVSVPLGWVAFALQYTQRTKWLSRARFAVLCIIPVITVLLIWTNEFHHLMWQATHFTPVDNYLALSVTHGPWFWVHVAYCYTMVIAGSLLILRDYFSSSHIYRQQSIWLVIGSLIPLGLNLIYIFDLIPGLVKDYSSISFALAAVAITVGILRYRLFDLKPIAHRILVESMCDGMVVLDVQNRIVEVNPAFLEIFALPEDGTIGQQAEQCLSAWPALTEPAQGLEHKSGEISLGSGDQIKFYDFRISPILSREQSLGQVIVFHDVTDRKIADAELRKLAAADPLTDSYNRRHFSILARNELSRSLRYDHPLSILMLDLDHFKEINDQYGHAIGDQVLQSIVQTCRETIRDIDVIGRYGGEEFVILLPETHTAHAGQVAERIREELEKSPRETDIGPVTVTASFGVCSLTDEADFSLDKLLDRADQALYLSKQEGRNRVTIWDEALKGV